MTLPASVSYEDWVYVIGPGDAGKITSITKVGCIISVDRG